MNKQKNYLFPSVPNEPYSHKKEKGRQAIASKKKESFSFPCERRRRKKNHATTLHYDIIDCRTMTFFSCASSADGRQHERKKLRRININNSLSREKENRCKREIKLYWISRKGYLVAWAHFLPVLWMCILFILNSLWAVQMEQFLWMIYLHLN